VADLLMSVPESDAVDLGPSEVSVNGVVPGLQYAADEAGRSSGAPFSSRLAQPS
jgi:hypothetical protein